MSEEFVDASPCYRCGASSREVVYDSRDYSIHECPFCGASERAKPRRVIPQRPVAPAAASVRGEYRLPHGRFAGKTLPEVYASETGRRYLDFMRSDPGMRDQIEAFLFSVAGSTPS